MSGFESPISPARHAAQMSYVDRLTQIVEKGGVVLSSPSDLAKGLSLAIQHAEALQYQEEVRLQQKWQTLQAGMGGCNGPGKKENPFEGRDWKAGEPEAVVVVDEGIDLPPPGYWIDVAAGDGFACGVANTGEGFCWGGMLSQNYLWDTQYYKETLVPDHYDHFSPFKSVVVGGDIYDPFACWLGMEDGAMTCVDPHHQYVLEGDYEGPYRQITAGGRHVCGLRFDHYVDCWGLDEYGELFPPKKKFSQIDAGYDTNCGILKKSGAILCWGLRDESFEIVIDAPGPFWMVSLSKVDGDNVGLCGIRTAGDVKCGGKYCPADDPGRFKFVAVSTSSPHWCILRNDGEVFCKQVPPFEGVKPWNGPKGPLIAISAGGTDTFSSGEAYLCGIRPWGELACWGDNSTGQLDVPWNPRYRHLAQ